MTNAEIAWQFGTLGLLLGGLLIFKRFRRRTRDFAEAQAVKGRLPAWVGLVERINWFALTILIGAGLFQIFAAIHGGASRSHRIEGSVAGLVVIGVGLIAVPFAMVISNWISWIVPPLRAANLRAMTGPQVSFGRANLGLVQFASVSIPVGLVLLWMAVAEPWRH